MQPSQSRINLSSSALTYEYVVENTDFSTGKKKKFLVFDLHSPEQPFTAGENLAQSSIIFHIKLPLTEPGDSNPSPY